MNTFYKSQTMASKITPLFKTSISIHTKSFTSCSAMKTCNVSMKQTEQWSVAQTAGSLLWWKSLLFACCSTDQSLSALIIHTEFSMFSFLCSLLPSDLHSNLSCFHHLQYVSSPAHHYGGPEVLTQMQKLQHNNRSEHQQLWARKVLIWWTILNWCCGFCLCFYTSGPPYICFLTMLYLMLAKSHSDILLRVKHINI